MDCAAERVAALEELKSARAKASYFQAQEADGHGVLTRRIQDYNNLEAKKASLSEKVKQQSLELEQVKSQLVNAEKEIQQACEFMAGK